MALDGSSYWIGKRYHPPGTSPGTLRPLERPDAEPVRVTVIDYAPGRCEEKEIAAIEDVFPYRDTATVTWINVEGLHDVPLLGPHRRGERDGHGRARTNHGRQRGLHSR